MKIKIATLILVILSLASCVKDNPALDGTTGKEGKSVRVELSLKIPPVTKPQVLQSRIAPTDEKFSVEFFEEPVSIQTRAAGTTELYNLWLFQFNADGSIHGEPQRISDQVHMVNDMALLAATLRVGTNQTLYLLALGQKVTPTSELGEVRTLSDLENISLNYLENRNGLYYCSITNEAEVPYGGKATGVTVRELNSGSDEGEIVYGTPDGFSGGIEIKRLVSRIQLKHRFDLTENKLEGLKLLKVPTKLYVNPASIPTDVIEALPMVDLECSNAFSDADKDANGFFTSEWYVAQNKRGTVAGIIAERDRYRKVDDGTGLAPELGTNIEAWSYSRTNRSLYTVHQIYVGNNNTSNFDVETNSYYNLRTIINSSDLADKRIRSYTVQQKIYLASVSYQSSGNGGGTAGGTTPALFDAHYGWRPVIIYAQGRKVTVGIYADAACTQLVDMNNPAQNWLQLSTYPNYTEVVRNGKATSLTNQLETSIFLPTRFKLYLYVDEYISNEDGSISDYTFDRTIQYPLLGTNYPLTMFQKSRTLYVKINTEEIGAEGTPKKLEAKFTMQQKQGYYTGLFGGELVDGQYTKGLIIDAVNEFSTRIDDIYPVKIPSYMYYGYNNVFTNYDWSTSNTVEENYRHYTTGKPTTYNLATNPSNHPVNTGLESEFPNMRKINGVIDLYQYDYHKTFYARFCHDLNRDKNGNGKIDYYPDDPEKNEFEWYLPSVHQGIGIRAAAGTIFHESPIALTGEESTGYSAGSGPYFSGWWTSNGGKTSWKNIRCVRDIPVPDERKNGTRVTTYTDGDRGSYVMIDLSNLPNGVIDRTTDEGKAEIYEELDLYSYSTTGVLFDQANPVADASKPLDQKVQRVIKNVATTIGARVPNLNIWAATFSSRKFIVSPTDVYNDGDTKSNTASTILQDATGKARSNSNVMTWAEANGRLNTANTQDWNLASQAMTTGCYAYKGKDGGDTPGTWRTPNFYELSVILLFAHDMDKYSAQTGFTPLAKGSSATRYSSYWCSSMSAGAQMGYASAGGGLDSNYAPTMYSGMNGPGRSNRLRCIKDVK